MKKEAQNTKEQVEDVVDAKGTEIVPAAPAGLSTQVAVSGVRLEFPFIRCGQGMCQWKVNGRKPDIGAFYIGKNKDSNVLVADAGKDAGITGIVLQRVDGLKEDRKWQAGMGAPRRWVIAGTKPDGTPVTEADCLEAAAKEGFSFTKRATGDVWPDTGKPVMRANLGRFCYLYMLIPLPEAFDSDEYRVYPIGDRLYTTARYEFERQYYASMDAILGNIKSRAEFAHRADKDYKWSVNGLAVHLYSAEMQSRSGVVYTGVAFEKALRDGKPFEFTPAEKEDFTKFLLSVKEGSASIDSVDDGDCEF